MATKKTTAKKAGKKKVAKKKKVTRKKGDGPVRDSKADIQFFMGALIQAGYLGKELPKETKDMSQSKAMNQASQRIRQMAEKLARQTRKFD